jgi:hypothetical protein
MPTTDCAAALRARIAEMRAKRAALPEGPWEFEDSLDTYLPYNLQVQSVIHDGLVTPFTPDGKHYGHPLVQMKTLPGWEPSRELADFIVDALNNGYAALRALEAASEALAEIRRGIETNGNDTVWVGPGCTAHDAIDAALARMAELMGATTDSPATGEGREG